MAQINQSDTETIHQALKVIERNARNQNQLISDILDVSRIIMGKLHLNLQFVRLSEIVQAAIDTVRPSLNARKIRLETFIEPDENIKMKGDADRLQQIIWNLLANAVKFTPESGIIKIALKYKNKTAEIIINDSGEGIETEFLPFVFDRFRQADSKKNRKHGGLGLGLAVVRHLTEMHGGNVSVASEGLGRGATFTIRLPLNTEKIQLDNDISLMPKTYPETLSQMPLKSRLLENQKILIVDDKPDALELTRLILSLEGAQILTAQSVEEALASFDGEKKVDAIITDIGIPKNDGFFLMQQLKERFKRQNIKIPTIALTAYAGETEKNQILEAGFSTYLGKPFESSELIKIVAKLILNNR